MPWFFRPGQRAAHQAAPPVGIICPRCGTLNPSDALFCNHCGWRLADAVVPEPPVAPEPAASAALEASAEERRIVTILFADLANSTALADTLDAEEMRALLGGYFALMANQIHRHGGTVEKFIGDAVMGVFGLPRAHEDDPVRAVRAALEMQAALRAYNAEQLAQDPAAPELSMRIGINTGAVVAVTGPAEGRDFLVTGDPVNVAARLQQIAAPGAVVVGPRTYREMQSAAEFRALPPAELKGKPRPIRVWQALRMADANPVPLTRPRSLEPPRTTLIGRANELQVIQAAYDRTIADRRPQVVTILGAPGVGKTRLAREGIAAVAARPPEPEVLVGRAALYGEGVTFWPLAEMLRDFCAITPATPSDEVRALLLAATRQALSTAGRAEDPGTIAEALAATIGLAAPPARDAVPRDPKAQQADLLRAWRVFFEALAASQPLILFLDDIHWADDALLDLVETIAARSVGLPILILGTARPELLARRPGWGGGQRNFVLLDLTPLSPAETTRLIDELLGGDGVPAELRASILRRGEGNPFFTEEIVRMLIDRGVIIRDGDRWQVAPGWQESDEATEPVIPDTVQGVLAARIDLLSHPEREVLRHAAVIGRSFWPSALLGMAPGLTSEELADLLRALVQKDLFVVATNPAADDTPAGDPDEPRLLFAHVLIRDVVYDSMPRARRALEHGAFAAWLEQVAAGREEEYAELLALHTEAYYRLSHLARSHDHLRRRDVLTRLIGYLELAGNGATARHATRAAIRYFSRALALLAEDPDDASPERRTQTIALHARRGDARALESDGDGAWQDYQAALDAWLRDADGDPRPPAALADQPNDERATGMRLYRRLVMLPTRYPSWFRHEPPHDELRGYLTAGLQLAEQAGALESLDRVALLTAKTFFWWSWPQERGQAQLRDALTSAEEAVRIAERLDAPLEASAALDALGNMEATVADLRGHLASQARRLYWARRISDRNEIVDIHNEVSSAHQMVGEYARAVEHATIALREATDLENDILHAQALQRLTIAHFEWDQWSEAIAHGTAMITTAARTPVTRQNHYRWGVLALAIALWRTGQFDRAEQVLHHLAELPANAAAQYVQAMRGRLRVAQGDDTAAERLLRAALDIRAGRHSQPTVLAELAELGARRGRADLTAEFGARAVDLADRATARKPLAQAIRAQGQARTAAGDLAAGRRDLLGALERFDALGTRFEVARTHLALATLHQCEAAASADPDDIRAATDRQAAALTLAVQEFERVGALRDAAQARQSLAGGA